jgi:uncharacterized protein (TIGR04255 family)
LRAEIPRLLEYETATPVALSNLLRKDFPNYERQEGLSISFDISRKEIKHLFKTKKGEWAVLFKASAIALETSKYRHFDDLKDRLQNLLEKSKSFLDTDFFTRVGLRYINRIPIGDEKFDEWIRAELVSPIASGAYGNVTRFYQEVRGPAANGHYTFRHGFADAEKAEKKLYDIDFDFYNENVPFDSVLPMVADFNHQSFSFFCWAIGAKTRERLGREIKRGI